MIVGRHKAVGGGRGLECGVSTSTETNTQLCSVLVICTTKGGETLLVWANTASQPPLGRVDCPTPESETPTTNKPRAHIVLSRHDRPLGVLPHGSYDCTDLAVQLQGQPLGALHVWLVWQMPGRRTKLLLLLARRVRELRVRDTAWLGWSV